MHVSIHSYMHMYSRIYVNLVEYMKYKSEYFYKYILYNTYILYTHIHMYITQM